MSFKPTSVPTKRLATSLTASSMSFSLNNIEGWDGANLTAADFGSTAYGVFRNAENTVMELFEFDPSTIANATITINKRGLKFTGDLTTEVTGNKLTWTRNETLVELGTDSPQLFQSLIEYIDGLAIAGAPDAADDTKGITKLSVAAASPTNPIAVGDNDPRMPSQAEKDGLAGTSTPSSSNKFVTENYQGFTPPGMISPYAGRTAPTGWLLCDGSAVSRTTYANLKAAICPSFVVTMTQASPCVFTKTGHGLVEGDIIHLTTTGGLYSGLAVNTDYYVIAGGLTADEFEVSTSRGGAAVNTTGSQSGVHTAHVSNWGKGDGSTTFNIPDLRGFTPYGYKSTDDNFDALKTPNTYVGEKTHQLTTAEMPAHTHSEEGAVNESGGGGTGGGGNARSATTGSAGGDTAHNNMPPYVVTNFIIKT